VAQLLDLLWGKQIYARENHSRWVRATAGIQILENNPLFRIM
jgi:hypothetical protein